MLFKTHLMFAVLAAILLITFSQDKLLFVIAVLISSGLPDMDSVYSRFGKKLIFRPIQFFVKHRGIFHSFSFALVITLLLGIFFPAIAFGFFIGYSVHLIGDALTIQGIRPLWPLKFRARGFINTGGIFEIIIFYSLVLINSVLFFHLTRNILGF